MTESGAPRVVWMVDDDPMFRALSADAAFDAGIKVVNLSANELIGRAGDALPDGAMLDGTILAGLQADEILAGVPRLVVCTGREFKDIADQWRANPHVRVLRKPMDLQAFQDAIRWLAGATDSNSWPTPDPDAEG